MASVGDWMLIGVAELFGATVSEAATVTGGVSEVSSKRTAPVATLPPGSETLYVRLEMVELWLAPVPDLNTSPVS